MSNQFKKYLVIINFLVLSLFLFCAKASDNSVITSKKGKLIENKIDKLFQIYNSKDSPGAAVAVVKDGKIIYKKGFGSAQLEYNIPITPATIFHVASISKQFTAMAITLLEVQGKLSVDDDIRKYLPEVPDFGKTITIRHLLHHTSGLRDQMELLVLAGWRLDDVITQEHIMNLVKQQKELNFSPGEKYLYSNTGYTLLAEIVSRVTGQPFEEWTKKHIFKPLHMKNSHFHADHQMIVKNRAYSYQQDSKYGKNGLSKSVLNYSTMGATGLFTTVEDMSKWMTNLDSNELGGLEVTDKMLSQGILNNGETITYARGLDIEEVEGVKTIHHGGYDAGFRTHMVYIPDFKLGIVVLSNFASVEPSGLCGQIALIYRDSLMPQNSSVAQIADNENKTTPKIVNLPSKNLKAFTGSYFLKDGFLLVRKIELKKGKLFYVRPESDRKSQLIPVSNTEFVMKEFPNVTVAFSEKNESFYSSLVVLGSEAFPLHGKRIDPDILKNKNIKEYAGKYYCKELDVTYNLIAENENLCVYTRNIPGIPWTSFPEDYFTITMYEESANIKFERNENAVITGFKISTGRAQNLYFKRVND